MTTIVQLTDDSRLISQVGELRWRVAVVGPRGDNVYPVPRRLYESLGFTTVDRTEELAWS